MRKTFIGLICGISLILATSIVSYASGTIMNQQYVDLAKEVVENHVTSVDTGVNTADELNTSAV